MKRRAALALVAASVAGCSGSLVDDGDDDHATESSNESDEREPTNVAYDDLSERSRRFVDEVRDGYRRHHISSTDDRRYITRDPETATWIRDDDPLLESELDEELREVIDSNGVLEMGGQRYRIDRNLTHGDAQTGVSPKLTAVRQWGRVVSMWGVQRCQTSVSADEFTDTEREIVDSIVAGDDRWIAHRSYEHVIDADRYYDDRDEVERILGLVRRPNECLEHDGEIYRVGLTGRWQRWTMSYRLDRVDG